MPATAKIKIKIHIKRKCRCFLSVSEWLSSGQFHRGHIAFQWHAGRELFNTRLNIRAPQNIHIDCDVNMALNMLQTIRFPIRFSRLCYASFPAHSRRNRYTILFFDARKLPPLRIADIDHIDRHRHTLIHIVASSLWRHLALWCRCVIARRPCACAFVCASYTRRSMDVRWCVFAVAVCAHMTFQCANDLFQLKIYLYSIIVLSRCRSCCSRTRSNSMC